MSLKIKQEPTGKIPMERRIIQVDTFPDHAGITAALRRAFADRPAPSRCADDSDDFQALLKQIH